MFTAIKGVLQRSAEGAEDLQRDLTGLLGSMPSRGKPRKSSRAYQAIAYGKLPGSQAAETDVTSPAWEAVLRHLSNKETGCVWPEKNRGLVPATPWSAAANAGLWVSRRRWRTSQRDSVVFQRGGRGAVCHPVAHFGVGRGLPGLCDVHIALRSASVSLMSTPQRL